MVVKSDFDSTDPVAWCPGCGNYAILGSIKESLVELGLEPWQVILVSGIGQAAKLPHYLKCNLFNGLHGRALPAAFGIKAVNHKMKVIVHGGDGDAYAEGGNHFVHAIRRNADITYFVHDNQIYALTKGQASPTTDRGMKSGTTPFGSFNEPEHPIAMAIALNCTFVARAFAGDPVHLKKIMTAALSHRGFAFVDILQPCVTFNKINTYQWYRDRVYNLDDDQAYNSLDRSAAFNKSLEWGDKIPTGIIYKCDRPVYEDHSPVNKDVSLSREELRPPQLEELVKKYF
ncbi:MAG: 2-oxoacid ferredoxin oxidoreductase [Candidatus Firestonebacteria bacterium RIFOXYC2_FULL_39_67]|nr:MAG: 2-oxoacid ferredoxin oxidoreductase [Candidatus Firestonebacteria bacterium RIFOXYD2_FULL_39_29]OGF56718.1 MAG: 2-oxoacid ferredoxin oxidoreductase [Candidatus Firestonebacteria bacterium RIFOXYC2_FULL_39_67]